MAATAPYIDLPLVNGGLVQASSNSVAYVRQDPAAAGRCFFGTYSQESDEPWHVALSADAMTAALVAAQGGNQFGPGRVLAAAWCDALGNPIAGFNLIPLPHVPGSGDYAFNVSANPGPWLVLATMTTDPPTPDRFITSTQSAPPAITVKVRDGAGLGADEGFSVVVIALT